MEKLIAPSAASAQAAQARLVLARLQDGLAAARNADFGAFYTSKLVSRLPRQRRALVRATQTILIRGLTRGIRAIERRPGVRRERSTDLFRTLKRRLRVLTRARKRRKGIPAGLQSLFAPPVAVLDVAQLAEPPAPTPLPPDPAAEDTTLTQTCPQQISTNGSTPFTVSGRLSPAPSAAPIRLTYTRPNATTFTRSTTADANGAWSDTIDPDVERGGSSPFGDWKVQSHFDGSEGFNASESSVCTVTVTD